MNTAVKTLFVTALRDYTYTEAHEAEYVLTETLEAVDAYGLLCSIHFTLANAHPIGFVPVLNRPGEFYYYPRMAMMTWAGLSSAELVELVSLSDAEGLTFKQIADVIEKEWV